MKLRVNNYEKHKDNLKETMEYISDGLSKFGISFDDITIYIHCLNKEGKIAPNLVDTETGKTLNFILDDETFKDKRSIKAGTSDDEKSTLYEFYGENIPSSKNNRKGK